MILEVAPLKIRAAEAERFERSFAEAQAIIASIPGYIDHQVHRCLEDPDRYLLLVRWDSLEDHTVGFRRSPHYQRWKAMLHHFYDPLPVVEHYTLVPGLHG